MDAAKSKWLIYAGILFSLGIAAVVVIPLAYKALETARRKACLNNLRMIHSARDSYSLEYGGSNGSLYVWYSLSLYIKDISNKCICPSSPGRNTNIPNDCYSIEPLGKNPFCRLASPKNMHVLSNITCVKCAYLKQPTGVISGPQTE